MKWVRTALRIAGLLLLAVVLALGAGVAALQTRSGKDWAAAQLEAALSGPDRRVVLGRVHGVLPFQTEIAELHLADRGGEWLVARDLELDIAARDLLRLRLTIRRLAAGDIRMLRAPESPPQTAPAPSGPPTLPHIPRLPVDLELRQLNIALLSLAPAVLGQEVIVTAQGSASVASASARAELAVRRIDAEPGAAELHLALGNGRLGLDAKVSEPSGLLLAALLGRDDKPPLAAELRGEGPLADWRGTLVASAGDLARLDAELKLAVAETTRISAEGTVAAAPLLPPDIAPLAGDRAAFALAGASDSGGRTVLDRLELKAAAGTLTGSGSLAGKDLAATLRLEAPDLAKIAAAFGIEAGGAATLTATAGGTTDKPTFDAELAARGLTYGSYAADDATVRLHALPDRDIADPAVRVALDGEGTVNGIRLDGAAAPAGLGETVALKLAGSADKALDEARLDTLSLTSGGATLTAHGTAREAGARIAAELHLAVADLSRFAALAGQERLAGKARLAAEIRRDGADQPVTATLKGSAEDLSTGIAAADALLAGKLDLAGRLRRDADGAIAADDLTLQAANLRVAAKAALPAAADRVAAEVRAELPRLAALSPALGTPMAGRATLTARLDGALEAPAGEARLEAADLVSGNARLDRLDATLTLADAKQPAGRLDGRFRAAELDGTLAGEFAMRDEGRTLAVPRLRLAGNGATVEAALEVALETKLATGTVAARIPDLKPWSTLAGMELAGRADLKAALGAKAGQTVELALNGAGLSVATTPGQPTTLERVAVNARLADLLGKPTGRAEASLGRLVFAGGELAATRVTAEAAKPGRFVLNGETRGTVRQAVEVALGAEGSIGDNSLELRLTRFAGQLAGKPFQLRRPLVVARSGADFSFAQLALSIAGGEVSGAGSLKGEALALKVAAKDLPVDFAGRLAGHDEVAGTLSLEVDLGGTVADPHGRVVLDGRGLRFAARSRPDLPPLGLVAEASWRGQRVDFRGRIAGPHDEAIGFAGAVPVKLRREPLGVEVPPDGAVALRLEGDGKLEDLADLLPLGEDRVAGTFHLAASVGGTVAAPTAGGQLTLTGGRYESMAAGIVLSDVTVELAGDRDRFVLRRFTASDSEKGTLSAQGAVVLSATPGPAFDLGASLRNFRAVKRDEATATASGEIRVGGTLGAPEVAARIRVEQAEIRIPDRMPPSVARLDVIEIDSRTGLKVEPKNAAKKEPALPARLDIVVDIPNQLFVRGRGLDSEWKGRVTIRGTSAAPDVVGSLQVVRGTLSLLGRTFTLTTATISFDGGPEIDPVLDITAEVRTADVTGQVVIGGRASSPTLKLTSTPELPQDEVLARVLFGRSVGQLSPAQGIQLAQAAATLAGGGPGILDRLRGRLGLDRLDIGSADQSSGKTGAGQNAGAGGTTVSAGKYLREGVYVGVDQSVSGQSKARVEVEVFPNVTVETDVGGQGGQGLGLNWKMDY
jgi:translocation and assembly module TamB